MNDKVKSILKLCGNRPHEFSSYDDEWTNAIVIVALGIVAGRNYDELTVLGSDSIDLLNKELLGTKFIADYFDGFKNNPGAARVIESIDERFCEFY